MGGMPVNRSRPSALQRALALCFSAFVLVMLGMALFANHTVFPRFETARMLLALGCAACAMTLLAGCIRLIPSRVLPALAALACACLFVLQCWFVRAVYTAYGWDCGRIVRSAAQLADGFLEFPIYFAQYPNNEALLLALERLFALFHALGVQNDPLVASFAALLLTDAAIALGFLCARRLLSREGAYLYLALSAVMIGMNLWAQVPYTDTCGMFLPVLAFYLWLRARASTRRPRRLLLCALTGAVSLLAMKLKPQGIILFIAVVLVELTARRPSRAALGRLARGGVCAACGLIAASALFTAYRDAKLGAFISPQMREQYRVPITQQLMMGAQQEQITDTLSYYGAWNQEDINASASLETLQKRTDYTIQEYLRRVRAFGPIGYLRFLFHKACWVYADGTFFYGQEGGFHFSGRPAVRTWLSRVFQSVAYEDLPGYQRGYAYFAQGFWLLTLALCALSCLGRERDPLAFTAVRLALLGLTLSILLFEGRSRYLLLYLPFFTLAAARGLDALYAAVFRRRRAVTA